MAAIARAKKKRGLTRSLRSKVHVAGMPGVSKQLCARCGAAISSFANTEPHSWRTGALVLSDGRGMCVVSPAQALNSRRCGRAQKTYKRPICIETDYVHPPIPVRFSDWLAWEEGSEDSSNVITGHGATRSAAVSELLEQLEDAGRV